MMTNKTECNCSLSIKLCGDGCMKCQPETYIFNLENALQTAEQEIEQLRSEIESLKKAQKWISVDERLPEVKVESFEFYLVTTLNLKTKKQSVIDAAFLNEMELYYSDDYDPQLFSGWHNAKESKDYDGWYEPLGNENCKVTHWMPLPPAPKG